MIRAAVRLAAVTAACGLAAAPAGASVGFREIGVRDARTNPHVVELSRFAHDWLGKRGYRECATTHGRVQMADYLGTYVDPKTGRVREYGGAALGCDIWVLTRYVAEANSGRWGDLVGLCRVLVHEHAHTAGMTHDDMERVRLELDFEIGCENKVTRMHDRERRVRRLTARKKQARLPRPDRYTAERSERSGGHG